MKIRLYIDGHLMAETEPDNYAEAMEAMMLWRMQYKLSYGHGLNWEIVRVVRWKTCQEILDDEKLDA